MADQSFFAVVVAVGGIWLICAVIAAFVADSRNQSAPAFFGLGLLVGPLAIIVVALMPAPSSTPRPYHPQHQHLRHRNPQHQRHLAGAR